MTAGAVSGQHTRALAAAALCRVVQDGLTLDAALEQYLHSIDRADDRGFVKELCFGTLRWFEQLEWVLGHYLDKPLKYKDTDLRMLILVGLYQLHHLDTPAHAAVSATVAATAELGKDWGKPLVNALLRRSQRDYERLMPELERRPAARYAHPPWLIDKIKTDWPAHWQAIVQANHQRPPQHLRVNLLRTTRADYLDELARVGIPAQAQAPGGIWVLKPVDVNQLPGFNQGHVSVQDAGAQLAAGLLQAQPGDLVLDACAAPGGKTAQLLETQPQIGALTALDVDARRVERLRATLNRLHLTASIIRADATDTAAWWDGRPFDRILLDAPCSATGVIRRHPDIKRLKAPAQLPKLQSAQTKLLNALWPLLKPGGKLLYATCSLLRAENDAVIKTFLDRHPQANPATIQATWGTPTKYGRQLLPGADDTDGFYYAVLTRTDV
ncbi:MAG: 16S rRNA (cytosine(967)-C(5))-methyltransferase RsmB [Gammaproteobacteria bacterium]|nr:16S rRNA (cytosine(967)-C(5))-methyltransferase RsmB [Gammaproteobacteria bacterium]